ncbi:MAG: hypothetical protein U9R02_11605 [Thermodesulfobacteriota bacterium]|nr:hypothetical protein [Thermodesulfobacteriota bacterium]
MPTKRGCHTHLPARPSLDVSDRKIKTPMPDKEKKNCKLFHCLTSGFPALPGVCGWFEDKALLPPRSAQWS